VHTKGAFEGGCNVRCWGWRLDRQHGACIEIWGQHYDSQAADATDSLHVGTAPGLFFLGPIIRRPRFPSNSQDRVCPQSALHPAVVRKLRSPTNGSGYPLTTARPGAPGALPEAKCPRGETVREVASWATTLRRCNSVCGVALGAATLCGAQVRRDQLNSPSPRLMPSATRRARRADCSSWT